ncbi:hypothetical protein FAZ69_04875 [Trinickia terrae]|uniref:Glycosyltransferase family 39 protein n=1 Tax=Trinickia terrae TaxID=2571161 RepID=A0A4U1IDW7_9BURK|nr:hypothetical protein [Trinickia terrae]TKC91777.1 hypothetical protein FAZ69_04875 [Trinickia terrae]
MAILLGVRNSVEGYTGCLKNNRNVVFLVVSVFLSLYLLSLVNPFTIPTIDDSAIVMRYLRNFQAGHFFSYNVGDGPVYGVSGFIYGLAAGILCWIGLDPQPSIMIISLFGAIGMFYCLLRIAYHASQSVVLSIIGVLVVYFSSSYLPGTLYLGLEVSVNLWLVFACFLYFFEKKSVPFYICGVLAIVSKLDTLSLVAGLLFLQLLRAFLEGQVKSQIRLLFFFFIVPLLAWIAFSTAVFGSPLPESFLSKFYFRQKAPRTSWFPFFEPMVASREQRISVALMGVAMLATPVIAFLRRKLFLPSLVMAAAAIGTLFLYFVYNPGEKMPWYYPLPELLMLLAAGLSIFDAFSIPRNLLRFAFSAVSICLAAGILMYRLPMNHDAPINSRYWQIVYESERRESGVLANAVAPKDHPVLWTGHGYPAYMFNGYVADYSGLNTKSIWVASRAVKADLPEARQFFEQLGIAGAPPQYKAEMYLIKMYDANVFMLHGLFPASVQKALKLRLAGSLYTIDLVGAPAFRVFVKDPEQARVVHSVPIKDVQGIGRDSKSGDLYVAAKTVSVPASPRAGRFLFGIKITPQDQDIIVESDGGALVGRCHVAKIADPRFPDGVRPCDIALGDGPGVQHLIVRDESGEPITLYEPAFEDAGQM